MHTGILIPKRKYNYCRLIEVKETFRKMVLGKAIEPSSISIEVGNVYLVKIRMMNYFIQVILKSKKNAKSMKNIYSSTYKIQSYINYRSTKLINHTVKLWRRVTDRRLIL